MTNRANECIKKRLRQLHKELGPCQFCGITEDDLFTLTGRINLMGLG